MRRTWLALLLFLFAGALTAEAQPLARTNVRDLGAANQCVTLDVSGYGTGTWDVRGGPPSGAFAGTITFAVSSNGLDFNVVDVAAPDTPSTTVNTTTAAGVWGGSVAGYTVMRACMTSYTSGTARVTLVAAPTGGGGGGGGGSGVDPVRIHDGTDVALVTAGGALTVDCATCSGTGVSHVDDAAFTVATDDVVPVAGVFNDVAPDSVNEGDAGALRMSANRNLFATIRDAAGNERGVNVTAGNALTVDGSAVTQPVSGTVTVTDGAGALNAIVDSGTLTAVTSITNAVTVTDGAGALNVIIDSGTTAVTNAGTFAVQESGGALTALQLLDNIVSVEDAVAGSAFSGAAMLAVRQDAHSDLAADGDFIPLTIDADGGLRVSIVAGAGSGGTALADDADFTAGTTSFTPGGGFYQSSVTACTDGDTCAFGITAQRTLKVTLFTAAGSEITVSSDVTEDAAETAGGTGPMVLSVRRDTAASSAGTSGDNSTFNTDSLGLLWTRSLDPCSGVAKTYIPIDISTATTTELTASLAGASNHYYICSFHLFTDGANDVALVDDDSDNCASVTAGIFGGVTAAEGWNFAANQGVNMNGGTSSVGRTNGTNRVLCLITSAATQLNGHLIVAAAP